MNIPASVVEELARKGWTFHPPLHPDELLCVVSRDQRGEVAVFASTLAELVRRVDAYQGRRSA